MSKATTIEKNNRFYEQPNGEMLTENEQLKEWLIVANKEIERLNNIINKKEQFLGDNIKRSEREVVKRDNIINELEKDLYKIRELTFNKYNSNEWNNCLSFNDDILPVINRLQELKRGNKE